MLTHLHGLIAHLWKTVFGGKKLEEEEGSNSHLSLLARASEEVLSGINSIRAGKVLRWVTHSHTPLELLICCLSIRPVLNFMGFLFKNEAAAAEHSITSLIVPSSSPVTKVIAFLLAQLNDLHSEFWIIYRRGGWTILKLQMAMNVILELAAGMWWRISHH